MISNLFARSSKTSLMARALCAGIAALCAFSAQAADLSLVPDPAAALSGGVDAPIQAKADPFKLAIADEVKLAASDEASANFQKNVLPTLTAYVNKSLSEYTRKNDKAMALDPSQLKLVTESAVRAYFVAEGAGNHNSLGFNAEAVGIKGGNPELIFPDASSPVSLYDPKSTVKRTASEPLLPGDFVNLGTFKGGTLLDFFLIANGASGGTTVFNTTTSANPDGINHVVSFVSTVGSSSYLVIAFEDLLGGGDRDFNDVIFALDIGKANVQALTSAPEPALSAMLGTFLTGALSLRRRRTGAALTA